VSKRHENRAGIGQEQDYLLNKTDRYGTIAHSEFQESSVNCLKWLIYIAELLFEAAALPWQTERRLFFSDCFSHH